MDEQEKKPVYNWCDECRSPSGSHSSEICLACIRTSLREQCIEIGRPTEFR